VKLSVDPNSDRRYYIGPTIHERSNRTERGSAGSMLFNGALARVDPALPRSVLLGIDPALPRSVL
jgi:hypothetical protein